VGVAKWAPTTNLRALGFGVGWAKTAMFLPVGAW
jgi:hypothetical protein